MNGPTMQIEEKAAISITLLSKNRRRILNFSQAKRTEAA
jgi:hypothetical protein